jgi:hypothetical protein
MEGGGHLLAMKKGQNYYTSFRNFFKSLTPPFFVPQLSAIKKFYSVSWDKKITASEFC